MKKKIFTFLIFYFFMHPILSQDFSNLKIIDLSHSYDTQTIYWPTEQGFKLIKEHAEITPKGYYYASNQFLSPEHGGTHIDAPRHFSKNGKTVDQIPLHQLMGNGILIDVQKECKKNRDYQIEIKDFLNWEKKNRKIPVSSIVLLQTGFDKYWPNRLKYLGTDEHGEQAVQKLHFPGLDPKAAKWLITERSIKAVGLDTASIDYGQSSDFQTHQILLGNNIPAFENLTNLDKLPSKNFTIIALPMKIKGGSGGPLRIIAILPSPESTHQRSSDRLK